MVINVGGATIRTTKPTEQRTPRTQQNLWSFDLMLGCLVILTAIFFLLTLYSILQTNVDLLPVEARRFLSLKILDTSSATTLFVTLLGALLIRHQFAVGLLPRINYKSTNFTKNDTSNPTVSFETWRVEVLNSGLGPAIVNSTRYILELSGEKRDSCTGNYQDIIKELAKAGLVRNRDYWLANNTTGFALSQKDDCIVFEIKMEHKAKIKRLDMVLYFRDQLGGKYRREIFFIPPEIVIPEKQDI